jgi:hypothetical protein
MVPEWVFLKEVTVYLGFISKVQRVINQVLTMALGITGVNYSPNANNGGTSPTPRP